MEKNWIKAYIVDILPCIAGLVYILAIVYNIAYFSVFGINVINYLTLSEMIMSIIEPLIFVIIITLLWTLLNLVSYKMNEYNLTRFREWKKNSCIFKYMRKIWNSSFVLKIRNICLFKWLKRIREKNIKKNDNIPFKFLGEILTLLIISYILYLSLLESVGYESGLYLAAIALTVPPFFFITFLFPFNKSDGKSKFLDEIKKLSSLEIASAIFAYYLFGLVLFFKNGTDSGEYYLHHNQTKFEIKTDDGTMFTDEQYGYVEQLNENIFLFEKKTGEVVILSKSNLNYTKIDFANTQKGLIPSLVDNFDKLITLPKRNNKKPK